MNINVIDDKYSVALQTKIRSDNTDKKNLRDALTKIGHRMGMDIVNDYMLNKSEITTPMNQMFAGYSFSENVNLVYSTKDDYQYFAKGITSTVPNSLQGYLDFKGARGPAALTQPIRAVSHPDIKPGEKVDTVIIAKAVLASGCTAVSLAKNIMNKYYPTNLIVASAFYSERGVKELLIEIPSIKSIYTIGKPDALNEEGMLIPGVGNLDERISS
ncbi:hypothetical protein LCL96_02590 [Rossellomorea aquimaris]|uniref:uracil phosphoribosyltransferase n=1 Tax=Rossellomorea aquimaris TaxID=189382 RepID=UPI001CD46BDE|nr:uracil phosphoribosyltransferase [Rossellomorea aquimaris]MCA1057801.1 hypothetical protein [Rossellomorea aquimaris]